MSGNIWEWTLTNYANADESDIQKFVSRRVQRGGSFRHDPYGTASRYRSYFNPHNSDFNRDGFRVAVAVPLS
jgi:formylglycine-generating enzyme required for sulfatase activity